MSNTFYSCFSVLEMICRQRELSIVNVSLQDYSPDRVAVWVAENEQEITSIICLKVSPTQFLVWFYGNEYEQVESTSYNFADVNTPPIIPIKGTPETIAKQISNKLYGKSLKPPDEI